MVYILCKMFRLLIDKPLPTKGRIIRIKYIGIFACINRKSIVHKSLCGVKAKDKQIASPTENQNLLFYILYLYLRSLFQKRAFLNKMNHRLIKSVKILELQIRIIHEAPLSTCMSITITVSHTGKIYPLRMSPLITHKVEIPSS